MAKKKSTKNRKQIKRTTRHFQLRTEHPQDQHVKEVLDYAKSQRREVTLIRDAIALYWALENGNLEALFEKFPAFRASFTPSTSMPVVDGAGQLDEIKSMLEMIAAQQQSSSGYVMKSLGNSVKPLPAPPVVEIKQSPVVSADAIADNFLSMFQ